jgi:hypothetical protein
VFLMLLYAFAFIYIAQHEFAVTKTSQRRSTALTQNVLRQSRFQGKPLAAPFRFLRGWKELK